MLSDRCAPCCHRAKEEASQRETQQSPVLFLSAAEICRYAAGELVTLQKATDVSKQPQLSPPSFTIIASIKSEAGAGNIVRAADSTRSSSSTGSSCFKNLNYLTPFHSCFAHFYECVRAQPPSLSESDSGPLPACTISD